MEGTLILLVVVQLAVFGVIVLVLKRVLLRDTLNAVNRLREAEAELGKKEEGVRRKIEENEAEFRRKSQEAQETLARQRETAEKDMGRTRDALMEEAKKERDRILDDAARSRDKMRSELIEEAESKAVDYAGRVYEMVFSREVGETLNRVFLDELLAALEEMDSGGVTVEAAQADLESSYPLDAETAARVKDLIGRKFGVTPELRVKVLPELIAGLKIKLGSLEIDGSMVNRFREAVEELKRSRA
jgi:F0F1-type ATP synthase delta subunit